MGHPVVRIEVRVQVGGHLMSGTDDPVFLGLRSAEGREFRLKRAHGASFKRGSEAHFVLAAPGDPETNVAHPELNDPRRPPLDAESITGVYLRKDIEPIPNVRGLGEMDDRLEVERITIEIRADGREAPLLFERTGPVWLGLVCGRSIEIQRADSGG